MATRHGHTVGGSSPTYVSWNAMMNRCFSVNTSKYPKYGAKGITVCERWRTFENFLADMGERPAGTSLDRYPDGKGNYGPGNCRWATPSEQNKNRDMSTTRKTHCRKGHPLTGDNAIRDPRGGRKCRICANYADRLRYAARDL